MTNTNTQETKKEFVKYWEHETPVVVETTKNEVRFFSQHGKVQVYPKIESGRGVGKGASIAFDGFTSAELTEFKKLYTQIAAIEVFKTHKSYWDKETPIVLATEKNEIRFYMEHGKVQVYPKIAVGRGIGRGATINLEGLPVRMANELHQNMINLLNARLGVDFEAFQPVAEGVKFQAAPSPAPKVDEQNLVELFVKYAKMPFEKAEFEGFNHFLDQEFSDGVTLLGMVEGTFNGYGYEEAVAVITDNFAERFTDEEEFRVNPVLKVVAHSQGIRISTVVDRFSQMPWDNVLNKIIETLPELVEGSAEEEDFTAVHTSPTDYTIGEVMTEEKAFDVDAPEDGEAEEEEVIEEEKEAAEPEEVEEKEPVAESSTMIDMQEQYGVKEVEGKVTELQAKVAKMSDEDLKKEYVANTVVEQKSLDPEYVAVLFEEIKKRTQIKRNNF